MYKQYITNGLTQHECAKYFKCSIDTIRSRIELYDIPVHKIGEWSKTKRIIHLDDEMKDLLSGAMLGDGSLVIHKNGTNANFNYISKSEQHVKFVCEKFMEHSSKGIVKRNYYDNRTNKTYSNYSFKTYASPTLTTEYHRWYKEKIKVIPNDLVLSPLICLVWYMGDGSLINSKRNTCQYISLSTDCFQKSEIEEILLPQLKDFDAHTIIGGYKKYTHETQYRIHICRKYIKDFLDYIGECPFNDYEYKWELKERKYTDYSPYYKEWEQLYKDGVKYGAIAKIYGADNSTVWGYLKKQGLK